MKKNNISRLLIVACSLLIAAGCASVDVAGSAPSSPSSRPMAVSDVDILDDAIREASDYLNARIPRGNKVAFISIAGGYPDLSDYILNDLSRNGVNDGVFSVVDRAQLEQVRRELQFNLSGEVSEDSAQAIGRMLGAQTIVTGGVRRIGPNYRIDVKAIAVETATVQGQWSSGNIPNGPTIADLTVNTSAGGAAPGGTAAVRTSAAAGGAVQASPAQSAGPKNGVYTFWPRLRPMKAGLAADGIFIAQITVTKDYMVIHYCRTAAGPFKESDWDYAMSGFYDQKYFVLQDLDNPSRSYNPVSAVSTNNGMGRICSTSFNRINSQRFKLECKQYSSDNPSFVFEEIVLGEPDQ